MECQQLKWEIKCRDNKKDFKCPADVKFPNDDPDIVYVQNLVASNPQFIKYHQIPNVNIPSETASSSTLYKSGTTFYVQFNFGLIWFRGTPETWLPH